MRVRTSKVFKKKACNYSVYYIDLRASRTNDKKFETDARKYYNLNNPLFNLLLQLIPPHPMTHL